MTKYNCPSCGKKNAAVEIIYGLPLGNILPEMEKRGEIELGGCCVSGDDPNRACKACGYKWTADKKYKAGKKVLSFR